jgi:ribosomal protein S18 acetylase RimI-like enzyme
MGLLLREGQAADLPFLREMLFEAVFWRASAERPSFEEGLAYPEVTGALADWGERDGDVAVVATVDGVPVGAAWYRYWTEHNSIRGYVDECAPVLVIGVHRDHRRQGVGTKLLGRLVDCASKQAVQRISLAVSKDNHAIHLYRKQGFLEVADTGDSFLMVREIATSL